MDDPDAIWKPGYDGPTPTVGTDPDDLYHPSPEPPPEPLSDRLDRESPARPARSRWWFGVGAGIAFVLVVLVAAVVALDPLGVDDESDEDVVSDGSVFGGPDDRRLPQGASELWSVDIDLIDDVGDHWVEVIRRDLVLVAVEGLVRTRPAAGEANSPDTALVAFDARTGEQRWTFPLDAHPNDVSVVGAVGDVLVVEQPGESSPTIIGIDTATGETRWSSNPAPNAGHVAVIGTTSVAMLPSSPGGSVSMIDASSGRELGAGSSDLAANDIASTGAPVSLGSLIPVFGSNFVVTAPGSTSGVVVDGATRRVVWSRNDGAVVDQHPIDGGTLLQVATRGGAGMELVDGLTGDTVENLTMLPGALQALLVAGDGIVVLRPAALGTRLVAVGFDGNERWSIIGSEPIVVGDRIVARAASIDGQLRISAYGDID